MVALVTNPPGVFDALMELYEWGSADVVLKFGGDDLPYSEYQALWSGRVQTVDWDEDGGVSLQCYDINEDLNGPLRLTMVTTANWSTAPAASIGKLAPLVYGGVKDVEAIRVQDSPLTFLACSHAVKSFDTIYVGGAPVTPTFTTPSLGIFNLSSDQYTNVVVNGAKVTWDGVGRMNADTTAMVNASDIVKDIISNWIGRSAADLDTTVFAASRIAAAGFSCSLLVKGTETARDVLDRLCRTVAAYLYLTAAGQYAFDVWQTSATGVTPTRAFTDDDEATAGLRANFDANRTIGQYTIGAAPEAQGSGITPALTVTDVIAQQYTRKINAMDVSETCLEDVFSAPLLVGRLKLFFGCDVFHAEITQGNQVWFDLACNNLVTITRGRAPDASGAGWTTRLIRILRLDLDPVNATSRVQLEDMECIAADAYGAWQADGLPNYAGSTTDQQAQGDFWSDDNGLADPGTPTSFVTLWG